MLNGLNECIAPGRISFSFITVGILVLQRQSSPLFGDLAGFSNWKVAVQIYDEHFGKEYDQNSINSALIISITYINI